jgi:hypothetical protein
MYRRKTPSIIAHDKMRDVGINLANPGARILHNSHCLLEVVIHIIGEYLSKGGREELKKLGFDDICIDGTNGCGLQKIGH